MLCDVCGVHRAVVYQRHTRRFLCEECFEKHLIKRISKTLRRYGVTERDRVLLAVSGGKDSIAMMFLLSKILPKSNLRAVMIIEGIEGYTRSKETSICTKIALELGIEYEAVHLRDIVGYSISEIVRRAQELGVNISPCSFCGVLRRRALNAIAREQGFTKVATAHTLNDEVQTAFLNILRGDIVRLVQWHPYSIPHSEKLIKRIKPLREIYEYELAQYVYIIGLDLQEDQCPYLIRRPTLRFKFKEMLVKIENLEPGIGMRTLRALEHGLEPLVKTFNRNIASLPLCERCGEPTSPGRKICRVCEYLEILGFE